MRVSHSHPEHFHKQLRRETRWQALRIALPAFGLAVYYLVTSAAPLFEVLVQDAPSGAQWQAAQAAEDGFTTGGLLTIAAFAVYYLAARALWRPKVVEATHETSDTSA